MRTKLLMAFGAASSLALMAACKSAPIGAAASANLNDPRMKCARTELNKLGYEVDNSLRQPDRYVATRTFPIVLVHRAAVFASIDKSDNQLEVWARVLRRDGVTSANIMAEPPTAILVDAMQVEARCSAVK